nr:diguanylate cyclase [Vibrio hyugaensis]
MSTRVFGWLTINQMLFASHLVLVLSIILGLSFTRFQSEWDMRIEHAATMAKTHLSSQMTFLSGSIAGRNYANLMMPSTKANLSAIDDLLFVEVSGVSDYKTQEVAVRYLAKTNQVWRIDVSDYEVGSLKGQKQNLLRMLSMTPSGEEIKRNKLQYLVNKTSVDLDALLDSQRLNRETELPWNKDVLRNADFYYDSALSVLHVCLPLRNNNGGYIWAVLDASQLDNIKLHLIKELSSEALIATLISMILIYVVTMWIVSPLKRLSTSMKKDIEKIDQSHIPEIRRSDEIGELARSYSSLITKIKNQLRVLRQQTDTDTLTGIGSRFLYKRSAPLFLRDSLKTMEYTCFVLCDIDNFKKFNDTYGHTEGDNALCDVAEVFRSHLGKDQPSFRLGGEEFALLVYGNTLEVLNSKVEHLRQAVETLAIPHIKNLPSEVVTISVGAVPITRAASHSNLNDCEKALEQAFEVADKNLYAAKDKGRNVVIMAEPITL